MPSWIPRLIGGAICLRATAWRDTVLYEVHVKGFTKRNPDVAPELRGTYAGFCAEPMIDHLLELGVTAVQLLPIHAQVDERALVERGLTNYWGYNSLAYFRARTRATRRVGRERRGQ